MKITVKVKPGSRMAGVEKGEDGTYTVFVKARPEKGRANKALIETLAEHFGVPKYAVEIKAGHSAKTKIVEVLK